MCGGLNENPQYKLMYVSPCKVIPISGSVCKVIKHFRSAVLLEKVPYRQGLRLSSLTPFTVYSLLFL